MAELLRCLFIISVCVEAINLNKSLIWSQIGADKVFTHQTIFIQYPGIYFSSKNFDDISIVLCPNIGKLRLFSRS